MNDKVFVDTNVLVYSRDSTEPDKQRQAQNWLRELWQRQQGCLSFQVLHEYYVTVTQKLDPGMNPLEARADIQSLLSWTPVVSSQSLLEAAWRIEDRFKASWWDGLIIAGAQISAARYLLTEDMQPGMDFEGVTVINPFALSYSDLPE